MTANSRSNAADHADACVLPGGIENRADETQSAPLLDAAAVSTPPAPSPAHDLQHHLDARLAGSELPAETGRWSARRTLAFVVVSNGLAWTALVWCAAMLAG